MAAILYISLLFLILYIITQRILHKLHSLPPTPFPSLPLIGHLHLLKKPFHRGLSDVGKRYGPAVFLRFASRPVLLVSSPSLAEECLNKNDIVFANRPALLSGKHFGYNYSSISWCPYGDHWRNLRRIASLDLLSSSRIQMLSQIRADEIRFLIDKLFRLTNGSPDRVIFVKQALFEFIFNSLTRMICGKRYVGEKVENSREAVLFRDILEETSRIMPEANALDFLPFLRWFRYRDTERKMVLIQKKRDEFMQNVIDECRSDDPCVEGSGSAAEKKILVEVMLAMQSADPEYYTDEMIKNLLLVLIQAGSDTSSSTLEWAFSLLLENPESLRKAQLEIDNLVGKNRVINEADLAKLPYLEWIIKETLRLHPPAPLLMPHESSAECWVGGYRIPGGTILLVNVWDIQRNPHVWEDPEKFKPERFGDLDGGKIDGSRFFPFGRGRRACPGENLATRMVALCLGSLIQCFDWEKVSEIDMNEGTGFTAPKIQPLTARSLRVPTFCIFSLKFEELSSVFGFCSGFSNLRCG